jgi:hypothetical protein
MKPKSYVSEKSIIWRQGTIVLSEPWIPLSYWHEQG